MYIKYLYTQMIQLQYRFIHCKHIRIFPLCATIRQAHALGEGLALHAGAVDSSRRPADAVQHGRECICQVGTLWQIVVEISEHFLKLGMKWSENGDFIHVG